MKTDILVDFQICISVPLKCSFKIIYKKKQKNFHAGPIASFLYYKQNVYQSTLILKNLSYSEKFLFARLLFYPFLQFNFIYHAALVKGYVAQNPMEINAITSSRRKYLKIQHKDVSAISNITAVSIKNAKVHARMLGSTIFLVHANKSS